MTIVIFDWRVGNTRGVYRHFHQHFEAEFLTYVHTLTDPRLCLKTPQSIPNSTCIGTVNNLSPSNSSRSGLTN
jgi:hypothetical protein